MNAQVMLDIVRRNNDEFRKINIVKPPDLSGESLQILIRMLLDILLSFK